MKKFRLKNAFMRVLTLVAVALFSHSCIADWPGGEDPANPSNPSAKSLLGFSFSKALNPALAGDMAATISGTDVLLSVPFGTNITALKPSINFFGASVSPAPETAQNFSSPVAYTVTAKDGSTQVYTVKVTVVTTSTKDITSFVFTKALNPDLVNDVTATITGTNITANLPNGTVVTALKPTILQNGNVVNPASEVAKDFTSPVTYTVTAQDNSTKAYTVTVTVSPAGATNPDGTVVGDVYIFGYENGQTKYWKNGVATNLGTSTTGVEIRAGFVAGTNDVYAVGRTFAAPTKALYWHNGTETELTDGTTNARAQAITVVGSDVYIGGFIQNNSAINEAVMWKNGVKTTLSTHAGGSSVNSIVVSGGDVYVAGSENGVGTIWKNGVATAYSGTTTLNRLRLYGTDVYALANVATGEIAYIKNGAVTILGTGAGNAGGLVVSNGDVYVMGSEIVNGSAFPVFRIWKNGTVLHNLTTGTISSITFEMGLAVVGTDVYASFTENIGSQRSIKYSKNGATPVNITDGVTAGRNSGGLFVVR